MQPGIQKEIKDKINQAMDDIIHLLEENRFEPSERGASTAPRDSAVKECYETIYTLIDDIADYGIKKGDLAKIYTLGEILLILTETEDEKVSNVIEDFDDLEEVDSFDGEFDRKYRMINTVYKHKPTGKHICVSEQRSNDSYEVTLDVNVSLVEKKEIITTEWA